MERFKPWKELVLALKSIADAIEGKSSGSEGGKIDNTIYFSINDSVIVKDLDDTKFVDSIDNLYNSTPSKLGDILNKYGVDIINNILDKLIEVYNDEGFIKNVISFHKNTSEGDAAISILTLIYNGDDKYFINVRTATQPNGYDGETTDKFTVDTIMTVSQSDDNN